MRHICSTSWCPSHSCRNVRIPLESTGMGPESTGIHRNYCIPSGIELESTGMALFLQEWNILNKIAYIYGLYLLNTLCIYICLYYICIYWSAYIYLNYYLVPFNTWAWDMLPHVSTLFPHVSPLLQCHTHSQLSLFHNIS